MTPEERKEWLLYRPHVLASCSKTRSGARWERRRLRAQQLVHAARIGDLEAVKKLAPRSGVHCWAAREAAQHGFLHVMDYVHCLASLNGSDPAEQSSARPSRSPSLALGLADATLDPVDDPSFYSTPDYPICYSTPLAPSPLEPSPLEPD